MIDQITVFLENSEGRLAALCRAMANAKINMYALTIADTSDYGLVRIICDDPERAYQVLKDANFQANITKVSAIEVPNVPGGLADLLDILDAADINIEYGYCFASSEGRAIEVLKMHGPERGLVALKEAGYNVLQPEDVYKS